MHGPFGESALLLTCALAGAASTPKRVLAEGSADVLVSTARAA